MFASLSCVTVLQLRLVATSLYLQLANAPFYSSVAVNDSKRTVSGTSKSSLVLHCRYH